MARQPVKYDHRKKPKRAMAVSFVNPAVPFIGIRYVVRKKI